MYLKPLSPLIVGLGGMILVVCSSTVCASCEPLLNKVSGVLLVGDRPMSSLVDGSIESSFYKAGEIVPSGRPILRIRSQKADEQINLLQERIANLQLQLLQMKNQSTLNQASLSDYERSNGVMSSDIKRRVLRKDEVEILDQTLKQLHEAKRRLETGMVHVDIKFTYPVLLMSDPPRIGETTTAGAILFRYQWLDRVTLYINTPKFISNPAVLIGNKCHPLRYVYGREDAKNRSVTWTYEALLSAPFFAQIGALLKMPKPQIPVFY